MPEYSSTTITPADGVQVPSMNGSTSGNFLLSALKSYILAEKGQANGLASLGSDGKLTAAQLPDLADDVIVVASYAVLPAAGTAGKLYITADNNKMYRWDPDLATPDYVELSVDLSAYATIADLQDGTLEPLISTKARKDQNGNVIDQTYETKADASDLKSAIQGNSARIENLEQEHGSYQTVNYRGTNDVPPNKAKYALVESIVGKSRAWNQLMPTASLNFTNRGLTISSNNDGTITISGTTSGTGALDIISDVGSTIAGRKYLLGLQYVINSGTSPSGSTFAFRWGDGMVGNPWCYEQATIVTGNIDKTGTEDFMMNIWSTSLAINITLKPIFRDLTLIFPEGVPSTVAECVQKCPDLLKYDAFGTSMVDETVSGAESRSINIVDQSVVLNVAGTSESDGFITMTSVADVSTYLETNLSWSNFNANTQYTFSWIGKNGTATYVRLYVVYTDGTSDDIATIDSTSATAMSGVSDAGKTIRYVRLARSSNGSFSFKELMVNEGTTAQPYIKYGVIDTLSLLTPATGKSAGSVADTDELNVEVSEGVFKRRQTVRTGTKAFDGTENWVDHSTYCSLAIDGMTMGNTYTDLLSSHFAQDYLDLNIAGGIFNIRYMGDFSSGLASYKAWLASQASAGTPFTINYPLRYPVETLLDPIENNTILTEGGGTINTIQTQTPQIDNCLDVGYLAL